MKDPKLKGIKNGNCNRTDCQEPEAIYFNYATRKWYCHKCAVKINKLNPEAHVMFGHDLCLYNPDTTDII